MGRFAGGEGFYNLMVNSHSFSLLDTWDCNIPKCFHSVPVYSFFSCLSLETRMLVRTEVKRVPICYLDKTLVSSFSLVERVDVCYGVYSGLISQRFLSHVMFFWRTAD